MSNTKLTENGDFAFIKPSENDMVNILFLSEFYREHLDKLPYLGTSDRAKLFARFIRDPRHGMGLKDLGRRLMDMTNCSIEEIVKSGRVDDLFHLSHFDPVHKDFEFICEWLKNECLADNELVKKWMPRYSSENKCLAQIIAEQIFHGQPGCETYVGMKCAYNHLIKANTTEQHLSRKETDKIRFENVPSLASIKYAKRFANGEDTAERYKQYLDDVKAGKKELHVATTTPYDIYKNAGKIDADIFFEKLPKISLSCLPIVDTSGSMIAEDAIGRAFAIGHYLAKCSSYMPDYCMSFSARPQLIHLGDDTKPLDRWFVPFPEHEASWSTYKKEINSMYTGDCSNTDMGKVFELLAQCDEFPEYLVVLSDMEWDYGSHDFKVDFQKAAKAKGATTKLVWWKLRGTATSPEMDNEGNIFLSGYNPQLLKFLETGFNAEAFLNKLLDEYAKAIL